VGREASTSKVEALNDPGGTPDLLGPAGTMDRASVTTAPQGRRREIKEWQAIMDYLALFQQSLPASFL
jgi:hypothetical protein